MSSHTPRVPKQFIQILLIASALLGLAWRAQPDGHLHVFFLATGGDAALVQTPAGGFVLIDGGSDPSALAVALGQTMPFWRRSLDAVVLTAADRPRMAGQVAALTRYHADLVITPPFTQQHPLLDEWTRLLEADDTPIQVAQAGQYLDLDGVRLSILASGDGRTGGMVLRLDYGATSVVYNASGSTPDETALVAAGILQPVTLLAYPWERDERTGFVAALQPRAIVFTDGYHSEQPFLETFAQRSTDGAQLYHEKLHGTIEFISNGRTAQVVTER